MKKYKVLRVAYSTEEGTIMLPDNVKLYQTDKWDTPTEWEGKTGLTCYSYRAIIPYTQDNWNLLTSSKQSTALFAYNLVKEYIVITITAIHPFDELPVTNIEPSIPNTVYCKFIGFSKDSIIETDFIKILKGDGEYFDCVVVGTKDIYTEDKMVIQRRPIHIDDLVLEAPGSIKTAKSSKEEFEGHFNETLLKIQCNENNN